MTYIQGVNLIVDKDTGFLVPGKEYSISGFTAEKKLKYLEAYEKQPSIDQALKYAGVTRATLYGHLKLDKVFRERYLDVIEGNCDKMELNVFNFGKKNFVAALAYLKAYRGHRWRERSQVEHSQRPDPDKMNSLLDTMKEEGSLIDVKPESDNDGIEN